MRLPPFGLALVLAAAFAVPAMAQTALPGTAPKVPTTIPNTMAAPVKPALPTKVMAPVNINTATADQLDTIPQIGPKRAAKIIGGRPYKTIDDLVTKKALSKGIFEKIKSHITV